MNNVGITLFINYNLQAFFLTKWSLFFLGDLCSVIADNEKSNGQIWGP